ncbi:MAG: DUF72 domain-containing protein [Desulfurococcales archaeon]|nr:DUF72 domain-containing protein [Desulfurococcales archaeon]
MTPSNVRVGTCGFTRSRRLIFTELDIVEIQQTFYDPRVSSSLKRIKQEAPEDFEFSVKAWMLVTHKYNAKLWKRLKKPVPDNKEDYGFFQDNEAVAWAWRETINAAEAIGAKVIVLQTPASFKPTKENVNRLSTFLSKHWPEGYTLAWEPRGEWWDRRDLLEGFNKEFGLLIAGDVLRGRMPPSGQDKLYTRLHGLGGAEVNYRYKYTVEDLQRLLDIVRSGGWEISYVLFNNVFSYEDAVAFKRLYESSTLNNP